MALCLEVCKTSALHTVFSFGDYDAKCYILEAVQDIKKISANRKYNLTIVQHIGNW